MAPAILDAGTYTPRINSVTKNSKKILTMTTKDTNVNGHFQIR